VQVLFAAISDPMIRGVEKTSVGAGHERTKLKQPDNRREIARVRTGARSSGARHGLRRLMLSKRDRSAAQI